MTPSLSETRQIDQVIAELVGLKTAIEAGDAFQQHMRRYNALWAVERLIGDDNLAAARDHDATHLEREFNWDAAENRPARRERFA